MNVCLNVHITVCINANMNIYENDPLVHLIVHINGFVYMNVDLNDHINLDMNVHKIVHIVHLNVQFI